MFNPLSPGFFKIFSKDFNLSLFVGLCLLALYQHLSDSITAQDESGLYLYFIIPTFNGFFTAVVMLLLNRFFAHKKYTALYYSTDKFKLLAVAFIGGVSGFYLSVSATATYIIAVVVILAAANRISHFFKKLSQLLYPHRLASTGDVGTFFNFFITLIISFALINLSLNAASIHFDNTPAFNFSNGISGIIDALYFSVITMTTVGYGDIIPQTPLARIFVSLQCVTCYLTLGIMIGIITRGISFHRKS